MESTDSSSASTQTNLPPGFRFHPTDEELVVHYLKRKAASVPLPVTIIAEIDLYKFDPWELPSKATFGEKEWYFFSPRDRKYPNGARPNRTATSGYWKATGTDKPIVSTCNGNQKVGVKKALVFYGGKPPKGIKTNWIMHEYRLVDYTKATQTADVPNRKASLRLDDWVLCRIYKKMNNTQRPMVTVVQSCSYDQNQKPATSTKATSYEEKYYEGILTGDQGCISSQIAVSTSSKQNLSVALLAASNTANSSAAIPPQYYWGHELEPNISVGLQSSKRFQGDLNSSSSTPANIDDTISFVSLLNQLPQNAPFYPAGTLAGDRQQFLLPSMNWNS